MKVIFRAQTVNQLKHSSKLGALALAVAAVVSSMLVSPAAAQQDETEQVERALEEFAVQVPSVQQQIDDSAAPRLN